MSLHSRHSSRALRVESQTDHLQSLMVPMGADRFRDIGRPRGGAAGAPPAAALAEWQGLCEQVFPAKAPDAKRPFDAAKQQYAERGVPRPHGAKIAQGLGESLLMKAACCCAVLCSVCVNM